MFLRAVLRALERGEISFREIFKAGEQNQSFENVAFTLRFMIDHKVGGQTLVPHRVTRRLTRVRNL